MMTPDLSPGSTGVLILCLVGYLLLANVIAFAAFALDKRRAQNGDWRIPEHTLLMWATLGGWPGAKLAQHRFRHKTRKQPFKAMLNLSVLVLPALAVVVWLAKSDFSVQQGLLDFATSLTSDGSAADKPALPRRFGPGS